MKTGGVESYNYYIAHHFLSTFNRIYPV